MSQSRLNLKNITALLADRDPFTRGLIAQMLRGFGIDNLLIASNGAEAKELVLANRTDILFLEGALPDMNTGEFIAWIRRQASNPVRFVPIIVLSGYTQLKMIASARDGGAHTVVRKPVAPKPCSTASVGRPIFPVLFSKAPVISARIAGFMTSRRPTRK